MSLASFFTDGLAGWRNRTTLNVSAGFPDVSEAAPDARRLIRDRRYCNVLSTQNEVPFDEASCHFAWKAIEHEMALVPAGEVCLTSDVAQSTHLGLELVSTSDELVGVDSLYLDRSCVTNVDFARFVDAGGYADANYWPEDVLPNVLQFVDITGQPGPKFWADGQPPADKLNHPVVGICWYEACAYATWAGKRLPSTEEWQRGGTWPRGNAAAGTEQRFPWGNAFDPSRANLWASGLHTTVPVGQFDSGNTPNGVRQLIGNVWEWVDAQFLPQSSSDVSVLLDETMAEIRGGAFDTYFHSQATCQFRSGQPLLFRGSNVGFRCCISANILPEPPEAPITDPNDP